jgi:4-amino-4-deoxy-L-arabinose transferase-like glycosyltransferase
MTRGGGRRNPQLALAYVMGGWFAVEALVLSVSSGIVHPYYVSALGPGTAAMTGAGAAAFVALGRRGRLRLLLPAAAMVASVGVALVLLRREHDYLHWYWPILVGIVGAAVVMMLWQPRVVRAAVAVGLGALLVVPAIYSATAWQVPVNGTFPTAGPYIEDDTESLGIPPDQVPNYRDLLRYVRAHQPPSRWDLLTQGATTAAPLTLLGGRVAALGGYGTIDPVLTPRALATLVTRGEVRYVALGGGYASNGGNAASTAVAAACREIPPSSWRSPQNIGTAARPVYAYLRGGWNLILYDCAGRTAQLAVQR